MGRGRSEGGTREERRMGGGRREGEGWRREESRRHGGGSDEGRIRIGKVNKASMLIMPLLILHQ